MFNTKSINVNRSSSVIVRAKPMKGKGKSKARDRDMWGFDSEDELYSKSPKSFGSSFLLDEGLIGTSVQSISTIKDIRPRNEMQEKYINLLETDHPSIVVSVGPAGVAKTYICNAIGIKKLLNGSVEKLIIEQNFSLPDLSSLIN